MLTHLNHCSGSFLFSTVSYRPGHGNLQLSVWDIFVPACALSSQGLPGVATERSKSSVYQSVTSKSSQVRVLPHTARRHSRAEVLGLASAATLNTVPHAVLTATIKVFCRYFIIAVLLLLGLVI